ncbi:MAG: LON peptidase substrate-binding domain-containing protein [Chitinophagaceae bacterium]|nr:LON peptidase substrate-binding domain-containing protein [Chitinophagaceae bacterium]MBK8311831.1 LON peptidase substrate-binding domain-containing protein [Chitinophagaceae bacterium]MBK8608004.1 LON peptidase substrate-binding domain-containing protein [Chitinophagaceae bacterium]MBP6476197.1 LON peptidase substrate-binding domain-containing protein [Chitinophagaceae bacterium]MBP7108042.1 LON peptidase substrate-binding domain-containing protein [Chitinophagaceae bacterium]
MTNFIPIFPLNIVVYPGENLNLHIFEPQYKQLINECKETNKPFGIPVVIENKVQEFGTLLEIVEVSKEYESGEMDIKTKGIKVFRMLEQIKDIPEKLYSGAIVSYPENYSNGSSGLMKMVMNNLRQLHQLIKVEKNFNKEDKELTAFEIAHHIGLSLEEEYEVLLLQDELQRQEYLKRHLLKAIPMAQGMEQLKEKIKLNGHFKNLSGFDL